VANVGRISGPLLKSNLLRDEDLAINSNLIYFDVTSDPANPKIGIINGSPGYELDVTGTINATDIRSGSLLVDDLSLNNSLITTTVGDVNVAPATATDFINLNGNVEVTGDIHATGSITADGNLTLGDADTDSITINADIASHILPDTTETYDLGSMDKRWRDIYLSGQSIVLGNIELKDSGDGSLQVFQLPGGELVGELGGLTEAESALIDANLLITGDTLQTTQSNSDLFIKTAGTGKVIVQADLSIGSVTIDDDILIDGNIIQTTASNSDLIFSAAGTGQIQVQGNFRVNAGTSIDTILDEDDLVSNSATALATQQSVKAYVDTNIGNTVSSLIGDQIVVGTPSDGTYTDGAYVGLDPTEDIAEAFDQLNETMRNVANNTFVRSVSFTGSPLAGGEGLTVTLNLTVDGNSNRYDITWGDGDVTTNTTDSTPSHTYTSNAGSPYTVIVRAYNNNGTGYGSEASATQEDYVIIYTADPVMAFGLYRAASGGSAITGNDKYVIEGDSLYLQNITTNTTMAAVTYSMNWGDGSSLDSIASDSDPGGVSGSRLQHTWGAATNTGTGNDTLTLTLLTHTTATPGIFPLSTTTSLKVYDPNIAAPQGLSTKTISITGTQGTSPKLAASATDNTSGTSGLNAGDNVSRIESAAGNIQTSATSTFAYNAAAGTLSAIVNGTADGAIGLSAADNTGTTDSVTITDEQDYNLLNAGGSSTSFSSSIYHPGLYSGFKARVSKSNTSTPKGINSFQLSHDATGDTNTVVFVKDDITTNPTATGGALTENVAGTLRYVSGVPHYNTGASLTLSGTTATNLVGQTYANISDVVEVTSGTDTEGSGSGIVEQNFDYSDVDGTTSMLTGGIPNADTGVGGAYSFGDLVVNINASNTRVSEQLRYRVRNVNGYSSYVSLPEVIQVHSASQSGIDETAIDVSASLGTGFSDDAVRIFDFNADTTNTPAYNSSTNFYTNSVYTESADPGVAGTQEATIRYGVLEHNTDDFSVLLPAGPDRSSDTGTQYFTMAFRRQVVANFDINITSSTGVTGVFIAAPGSGIDGSSTINGWLECAGVYNGVGLPGASGSPTNTNGCAVNPGERIIPGQSLSGSFSMTLGTANMTDATGNVVLVRIALAAGESVTALSIS